MRKIAKSRLISSASLLVMLLLPALSHGDTDPGNQYCVTPPFVSGNISPNLLLMIDNSASMYDLAFVDKGKKHCSATGQNCFFDSDCTGGPSDTCTVFDRQPYYCFDQTYSNSTPYAGYFPTKAATSAGQPGNDLYYSYDFTNNAFRLVSGFPADCGTHTGTITKKDTANNTLCVEYKNDSTRALIAFTAKGNYLNWLTASKFDVEKQILTGGKFVSKVCSLTPDRSCNSDTDCPSDPDGTNSCTSVSSFAEPESRGCVGQGFIKNALAADFLNYATTSDANYGTDKNNADAMQVTFSVRGPANKWNSTAPSIGGQTYIDLFASNVSYNFSACQTAVNTLANTSSSNADVKKDVAACLAGQASGYCENNSAVSCFSTYPDCTVPGSGYFCEGTNGVLTDVSCTTPGVSSQCPSATLLCDENNPSPYTSPVNPSIACTTADSTSGCKTPATYWCDWSTSWRSQSCDAAKTGDPVCASSNNQNGKCSLKQQTSCQTDDDCIKGGNGVCQGYIGQGAHNCVQHTPAVDHGTCRMINGATNGICGATKDYGSCIFGSTSLLTKAKVNFQQTMQACWQYNRYIHSAGGNDIGTDDLKTLDKQCSDLYNGSGSSAPYRTCSQDHTRTCAKDEDCGGNNSCTSGPLAIAPGYPALICGQSYAGQLYYQSGSTWYHVGSLNDSTHPLSQLTVNGAAVPIPTQCTESDTLSACMKKIHQGFCQASQAPGVTDPTDAPSNTPTYDNLPAILSGIGVESQLGAPVASMRARVLPISCNADSDCPYASSPMAYTCSSHICQPAGLMQKFGSQIRIGAMDFNTYGSQSEASATAALKIPKVCSNNPTQSCTQPADCGPPTLKPAPTCDATANLDGGSVIYPIGLGHCYSMSTSACGSDSDCSSSSKCVNGFCGNETSTVCTTAQNCSSSQPCVRNTPGDHATASSLVQVIDSVRANAWTPFAETFYNALGYFAAVPQSNGITFNGRTDLRLNSSNTTSTTFGSSSTAPPLDFNERLHPSEYRCQQNYALLVTDGSSTADRNSNVSGLASLYASQAGTTAGSCPPVNGVDYGGTSNLPIMSWIGRRQNLATFSTSLSATPVHCSATTTQSCSSDSDCPKGESCANGANPRDYLTTYVVLNGADNGATGICDAQTLLGKTATNGGTTLSRAERPDDLANKLTNIFQNIAAKASSGTAASILSNSEGSGANILQAVFYPKKIFDNQTAATWIGEMQNLWYYVDPQINHSTIREDSDGDLRLNLISDKVVSLRFNPADNTTYAYTSNDTNGDGTGDTPETKEDVDLVKSVWRAGKQLWQRDLTVSPRTIYTPLVSGGTQVGSTGLMTFSYATGNDNSAVLAPYLQEPDANSARNLMKYVHGFDFPGDATMRSRTVQIGALPATSSTSSLYVSNPRDKGIGVWKLGDIISSTPRLESNVRLNSYGLVAPAGYADPSYNSFVGSNLYKGRGMVYAGANDGMLHAFKLGLLDVTGSGYTKARLSGTGLGEEQWAFIPKQALPYLKYSSSPTYGHIYYMDGSTVLADASIGNNGVGCTTSYDTCVKSPSVVDSSNNLNSSNTWRTVLIGGMGLGGASAASCTTDSNCVATPTSDPAKTDGTGLGYSSYYALDVTDPTTPSLLWEFSNPGLGYATTGPAIVRVGDRNKNGRWFAVFGSGPTGPIDTTSHQFMGRSDQNLKFFVVDLATGSLVKTIDTGIANAFAGSMLGGAIDADRWNPSAGGNYQDDAIYVGYTKKSGGGWTDGGVLRIVTKESTDPNDAVKPWTWSTVIDGVGPVTSSISRLQDRKNKALWLYFGTGRFYSRAGGVIDDFSTQRAIYGVKDKCYNSDANPGNFLDKSCSVTTSVSALTDQSNPNTLTPASGIAAGWMVTLDAASDTNGYGAERVVTDAVALTNGTVFLTSFEPTADPCGFGGNSFLWALDYQSGARPQDAALGGKALIQLSTGEFKEVDLSQAFGADAARGGRRTGAAMTGKPPADAFPVISKSANRPVKRILHIQER